MKLILLSVKLILLSVKLIHNAHARVMEFAECNSVFCASDNKAIVLLPTHTEGNNMATASKLMLGAVIAAVSIASPALAAHKSKPISDHQNGYLTQSSHRSGSHAFASVPVDLAGRPYPALDRNVPLFDGSFGGQ